ncbi:phosphoprotein [Almpiwar virus]|uniref:Phosphoprotein n=1 Tax=Almpiwar virus TaxID=318843 RepID=A0A024A0M0_9RHAB|nr:phosphoprotein [Almpiwar virus]AHY85661.1 phosphoprotein [Almpiwar virus]
MSFNDFSLTFSPIALKAAKDHDEAEINMGTKFDLENRSNQSPTQAFSSSTSEEVSVEKTQSSQSVHGVEFKIPRVGIPATQQELDDIIGSVIDLVLAQNKIEHHDIEITDKAYTYFIPTSKRAKGYDTSEETFDSKTPANSEEDEEADEDDQESDSPGSSEEIDSEGPSDEDEIEEQEGEPIKGNLEKLQKEKFGNKKQAERLWRSLNEGIEVPLITGDIALVNQDNLGITKQMLKPLDFEDDWTPVYCLKYVAFRYSEVCAAGCLIDWSDITKS